MSSELKLLEKVQNKKALKTATYQRDLDVSDQPHSMHYILEMADT